MSSMAEGYVRALFSGGKSVEPSPRPAGERDAGAVSQQFQVGQRVVIPGGLMDMRGNVAPPERGVVKRYTPPSEGNPWHSAVVVTDNGTETRPSWREGAEPGMVPEAASNAKAEKINKLQEEVADLQRQRDEIRAKYEKAGTYSEAAGPLREQFTELTRQIQEREDSIATLNGEPTRSEKRDMQKRASEASFAERPAKAMKYGDPEQSQPWQVKEADFIKRRLESEITNYERGVKEQQAKVDSMKGSKSIRKVTEEATLKHWQDRLKNLKSGTPDPSLVQRIRETYIKTVKEAISHGKPVPQEVIDQRPEFTTARDARERYEKGRHTSFANRSAAINDTMQAERGYKVKRQDGKAMSDAQHKEIEQAVSDVESVLGNAREIMRGVDLTVVHTNGRFPFLMSDAAGLYSSTDRRITMGLEGFKGSIPVFAHEFAHMIDIQSGHALGRKTPVYSKGGKRIEHQSLAEADARGANSSLLDQAIGSINNTREVRELLRTKKAEDLTPEEKAEIQAAKVQLGTYWREPREVFARLVEQYIANKLGKESMSAHSPQWYAKAPGWWTQEQFNKMEPQIKAEIDRRMNALREKYPTPATENEPSGAGTRPETSPQDAVQTQSPIAKIVKSRKASKAKSAGGPIPALRAKGAVEPELPEGVTKESLSERIADLKKQMDAHDKKQPHYGTKDWGQWNQKRLDLRTAYDALESERVSQEKWGNIEASPEVRQAAQDPKILETWQKEYDKLQRAGYKNRTAADEKRMMELDGKLAQAKKLVSSAKIRTVTVDASTLPNPAKDKWAFRKAYFQQAVEKVLAEYENQLSEGEIKTEFASRKWDGRAKQMFEGMAKPEAYPGEFVKVEVPGDGKFLIVNNPTNLNKLLRTSASAFSKPTFKPDNPLPKKYSEPNATDADYQRYTKGLQDELDSLQAELAHDSKESLQDQRADYQKQKAKYVNADNPMSSDGSKIAYIDSQIARIDKDLESARTREEIQQAIAVAKENMADAEQLKPSSPLPALRRKKGQ